MLLTESELIHIIAEAITDKMNVREKGITRETVMDGVTLYHRPKDAQVTVGGQKMSVIDSLFKYGFSREFTSSNGGNMYGPGVYSVYNLRSSNEKARGYGSAIIKLKLIGGYKDFLIFSKQIAQSVYGENWRVTDQVRQIFNPSDAQNILKTVHLIMHDDTCSFRDMARSSEAAYNIVNRLGEAGMNNSKCRGLVYNGGHDGGCCFIRDFSSAIPVAVSYDNGKNWKYRLNDELIERMNTEVDTYFQYGANKEFKDVADKAINGYTMVWNKTGKVNYIPSNSDKTISDIWFDDGQNWEKQPDGTPYTYVKYGEYTILIKFKNGQYNLYEEDGCPLDCTLKELPSLFEEN